MSLTTRGGPLGSQRPLQVNYRIDGPQQLLFFDAFPRRVRATFAQRTVIDSSRGRLLHESGHLPALYVPDADISTKLLQPSDHTTRCPYKGDASYWSVHAGDRVAANAVWAYPAPFPAADWLRGYRAVYWDAMDAWYDEAEQVYGHLRDPYHRVDARVMGGRVRVLHGDAVLADSTRAKVLSETGLPNRYYLPRADLVEPLRASSTTAVCPYKGTSTYWSTDTLTDVAWSYEEPLADAAGIAGYVCFLHGELSVLHGELSVDA